MQVVVHDPYANSVKDRAKLAVVTKVGRTLVTTDNGWVFDTAKNPPRSKGGCPSHRYLYTPQEFETVQFKAAVLRVVSTRIIAEHHPDLDELLYIAIALRLEIPTHLQERAYEIHQELTATIPTPAELTSASGERERPLPHAGTKV